jgi:hypothetical protein
VAYSTTHIADPASTWKNFWGEPHLGYYSSSDPSVIRQHAAWLVDAGVDFIYIDWSNNVDADIRTGSGNHSLLNIEKSTLVLFDEFARLQRAPKVAIMIGFARQPGAVTDGRLQRKADQVYQQFIAKPEYQRVLQTYLGKPLLIVYTDTPSPYQNGLPPWSDARFTVRYMTGFVTQQPRLLGTSRLSKFGYWTWEDRGEQTYTVFRGHPEALTVVPSWRGDSHARIPAQPRDDGQTFRAEWARARIVGPKFVLVNTFNEWAQGEDATPEVSKDIEPCKQFGTLYLDILKEQAALFKAGK